MPNDTIKWLTAAALAVAKRQSDDEKLIDYKLKSRTLRRFMQHLGITLMRAQAHMIFKYALANSRSQYITAPPRGVRASRWTYVHRRRARGPPGT